MSGDNLRQVTEVKHPLVQHKLSILRKKETSTCEFRNLLHEIGLLLGYEATRNLPLEDVEIETPVAKMTGKRLAGRKLCLLSILRAGEGLLSGFMELVPSARVAHIGLVRNPETLEPDEYFFKAPSDIDQRLNIAVDPMLATGGSAIAAITAIKQRGAKNILFVCLVAAPEGIEKFHDAHPDVPIVVASVDDHLNEHGYIVPGLGDAGDRIFGTK